MRQQPLPRLGTMLGAVAAGVAILLAATACSSEVSGNARGLGPLPRLEPDRVEDELAGQFDDQEGVGVELDCPDRLVLVVGRTYECTGETGDGEDVTLRIEITSADEGGEYTWEEV